MINLTHVFIGTNPEFIQQKYMPTNFKVDSLEISTYIHVGISERREFSVPLKIAFRQTEFIGLPLDTEL